MESGTARTNGQQEMTRALHDLCQPLTALQCGLELGQMLGDQESLREAIEGGLVETRRLFAAVAAMRAQLQMEERDGGSRWQQRQ